MTKEKQIKKAKRIFMTGKHRWSVDDLKSHAMGEFQRLTVDELLWFMLDRGHIEIE